MAVIDYEKTAAAMRSALKNYCLSNRLQALVIGESGGIDSALCTALASPVCKELGIKLIGRSITIETNKPDEIARGKAIGSAFCTDFKEVNLTDAYLGLLPEVEEAGEEADLQKRLRRGNIKARMRMIYLYNLAQLNKGLVLSTDNYTEFLLGFWTLHGDVGDYGMIQELWKTEVYGLSQYLVDTELSGEAAAALSSCIAAVPTDGLGISNSDLDQLGAATYTEVDQILQRCLDGDAQAFAHPVGKRHVSSSFKRSNPLNLRREDVVVMR